MEPYDKLIEKSRKDIIRFYCWILEKAHWTKADMVIKEMEKALILLGENYERNG